MEQILFLASFSNKEENNNGKIIWRWNNDYGKSWISKCVGDIKMKILSIVCLTILFLITSPMLIIIFGSIEIFKLYKHVLKTAIDFLEKN